MNETSSRSHAIFTIYIDRQSKSQKLVYNVYCCRNIIVILG